MKIFQMIGLGAGRCALVLSVLMFLMPVIALANPEFPLPDPSQCEAAAFPIREPGTLPGSPGIWWDPDHYGEGWNIVFSDDPNHAGKYLLTLFYYTYDSAGQPIWYITDAASYEQGFRGKLYESAWRFGADGSLGQQVSSTLNHIGWVSLRFIDTDQTRAAISVSMNTGGNSAEHYCLEDFSRYSPTTGDLRAPDSQIKPNSVNMAFNGAWHDDTRHGWGLLQHMVLNSVLGDTTQYVESVGMAVYDDVGKPRWLLGVSQPEEYAPEIDEDRVIALDYFYRDGDGVLQHEGAGSWTRKFLSTNKVEFSLNSNFNSQNPSLPKVTKFDASSVSNTSNSQDLTRLSINNYIVVDRAPCIVYPGQLSCAVTINWSAAEGTINHRITAMRPNRDVVRVNNSPGLHGEETYDIPVDENDNARIFEYCFEFESDPEPRELQCKFTPLVESITLTADPIEALSDAEFPSTEPSAPHTEGLGAIAGSAGVSGGAATYSVPIPVPPGRRGMQPSLSLNYSSRSGNGIAGMGVSLSAESSVHRCPMTVEQDGYSRAVQLDGSDKLCLDGQRLVAISGNYGAAETVYRTEIESFVRVKQFGDLNSPNTTFEVRDADNQIRIYGAKDGAGTAQVPVSATHLATTLPPMAWMLAERRDPSGNMVRHFYNPTTPGEYLLRDIKYTGHRASASSPTDGTRVIHFVYEARADTSTSYLGGGVLNQTQRLRRIEVSAPNSAESNYAVLQRQYELGYRVSPSSGRSQLASITEKSADGTVSRPATILDWHDNALLRTDATLASVIPSGLPGNLIGVRIVGDVNGDGHRDLVARGPGGGLYLIALGASRNVLWWVDIKAAYGDGEISDADITTDHFVDIDMDGRADMVGFSEYAVRGIGQGSERRLTFYRFSYKGTPSGSVISFNDAFPPEQRIHTDLNWTESPTKIGDVNADGRPDLLITHNSTAGCVGSNWGGRFEIRINQDTGNGPGFSAAAAVCLAKHQDVQNFYTQRVLLTTDLNGDSLADVVLGGTGADNPYDQQQLGINKWKYILLGRATAGGAYSLVNPGNPSSTTPAKITDWVVGKSDMREVDAWGYDEVDAFRRTGDINGDGLMDVLWVASRDGTRDVEWALRYGNGRGFSPIYWTGLATGLARITAPNSQKVYINSDKIAVVDTNGDGKDELVYPTAFANLLCQRIVRDGTPRAQESGCQNADTYQPERLVHPDDRPPGCMVGTNSMGNNLDVALPPYREVVYACPEDPNTGQNVFNNNGGTGAAWVLPSGDPLSYGAIDMYSNGFGGLNSSTYKFSSADIVEISGSWAARPVSSNMVEVPSEDLFSDGLTDAIYIGGCIFSDDDNCGQLISLANIQPPVVFNFDSPFARTHRISQNLGHGPSSSTDPTPLLPDMLQGVSEPVSNSVSPSPALSSRIYEWRYSPLSGRADRSSSSNFPLYSLPDSSTAYRDDRHFYFTSSMPVVAEFSASTGVLNPSTSSEFRHTVQYGYGEAMYHAFGRGFQGFRRIVERDLLSRIQTETLFHQRFPLTGRVESQTSYVLRLNNTLGRLSRAQTTWACDRSNGAACPDSGANWTSTNFPFVRKEVVETFDEASASSGATELLLSRKTVLNEAVDWENSVCPGVPASAQASGYSALGNLTQRYELVEDVSPGAVLSRQCSRTSSAFDEGFAPLASGWWVRKPASTTVEQRVVYAQGAVPSTVASALFQPGSVQTEYVWNSTHRAPASTTVRTVNADIARNGYQTTTWTYATNQPASKYGQPDSESISGTGVTALRTTSYEYDSAGYFPARVINPLAHAVQTVTRPIDGQPASITDADGRVTRFGYDDFGLLTATYYGPVGDLRQPSAFQGIRPCGPSAGGEPCPAGATAVRIQLAAGSPEVRTYVDGLGREVAVETQLRDVQGQVQVNGPQYNRVETHYNERGLVEWSSQPQAIRDWGDVYLTDLTTSWVPTYRRQVAGYDVLGRPGSVTEPRQLPGNSGAPGGNQKTTYTYVGLTTNIKVEDTTNPSTALTMSRQVDALGRPVLTTDASAAQGKNRYFYDAYGQTVALVDARGVATRAEYDPLGRRWVSNDPNLGTTQFTYNGLGELLTQTDARNRKLTFHYDALGRNTERETNGGDEFGWSTSNSVKDIFEYDPENALGQLASHRREMTGKWTASGEVDTFTERKQRFVYNAQGRLIARNTEQAINLSGQTGTRLYSHRYRWDSRWGRLLGEAWPNGVGRGYHYDGVGRVILETGLGTNMPTVLRAVQEIDARGQVVKAELGDCVTGPCIAQERSYAPSTGQMLEQSYSIESPEGSRELHSERYRHDYLANLSQRERLSGTSIALKETYTYDALQRLRTSQVYSSGSLMNDVLLEYDAVGNLTKKSDYASTYTYPGVNEARPNAVTSTYGGPTGTLYYDYDASGNLIARSPNDPAPISSNNQTFWARYNHNHQVIFSATRPSGGSTAWTAGSQYFYDAQNRLSRQVEGGDGASEHLIYLEGYEDRVGGYRTRSYVDDYAHLTRYRYGQLELRFVLTDRLGSVVSVVRADRDSGGYVTALEPETGLAYDVFGTPRDATTWAGLDANEAWPQATTPWDVVTPTTRHGFTGHEMLSKQRLIHMRGRLFDPRMGRFTGVDPVIQFPLSTQGLNPYSYLLNNPLAGTDPTGYATCFVDEDWASSACAAEGTHTIISSEGENLGKIHNGSDRVSYVPTAAGHAFQSGAQRVQGERTEQHQESSDKGSADSRANMPTVGDKVAKAPILLGYRPDDNADRSMGDAFLHKTIGYPVGMGDIGYSAPPGSGEVNEVGLPGDVAAAKLLQRAFGVAKVALTGFLKGADDVVRVGAGGGLAPLRQAYVNEVRALEDVGLNMRAAGATPEHVARQLHQMRRDLGVQYKDLTPAPQLEAIYARNLQKYGDKLGPTVDWLRAQGKSWEQIIDSASRSGGKDLGL